MCVLVMVFTVAVLDLPAESPCMPKLQPAPKCAMSQTASPFCSIYPGFKMTSSSKSVSNFSSSSCMISSSVLVYNVCCVILTTASPAGFVIVFWPSDFFSRADLRRSGEIDCLLLASDRLLLVDLLDLPDLADFMDLISSGSVLNYPSSFSGIDSPMLLIS